MYELSQNCDIVLSNQFIHNFVIAVVVSLCTEQMYLGTSNCLMKINHRAVSLYFSDIACFKSKLRRLDGQQTNDQIYLSFL